MRLLEAGEAHTLKPSLAIWAAKRLALISVERRSKWSADSWEIQHNLLIQLPPLLAWLGKNRN
jgi:hypothetical protein